MQSYLMDTEERVLLQRKTFVIAVGFILFLKEKGGICNIYIYIISLLLTKATQGGGGFFWPRVQGHTVQPSRKSQWQEQRAANHIAPLVKCRER